MDLPLFPTITGVAVKKADMVATIVAAATKLGTPLTTEDGKERVSGHSLRATGAQGLVSIGIDTWTVQLLGRWGTAAVLGYTRDAAAGPVAACASHFVY